MSLPANLPSIANAKLPKTYEHAKTALAECTRLDECDAWANKAEAMASYAKQAEDDALLQMAQRIKARAIRRCGELLKAIARPEQGGRPSKNGGDAPPVSRTSAASTAGLSRDRMKQALRIANIPEPSFEAAVESPRAPSIKALAERGKRASSAHLGGRDPQEYARATEAQGHLRRLCEFAADHAPEAIARGILPHECRPMQKQVEAILPWLGALGLLLEERA